MCSLKLQNGNHLSICYPAAIKFLELIVLCQFLNLTTMSYSMTCDVILTRSESLDTGYGDLDDATSSEGR